MAGFNISALLKLDGSQFQSGMGKAEGAVSKLAGRLAALFSIGAISSFTRSTIQWASKMTDLAAQTGIAVEELQRMDAVARKTGTSINLLTKAFQGVEYKRFQALQQPEGATAKAFGAFGIGLDTLKTASTAELFKAITAFVAKTPDKMRLIGPLRAIFEETGPQMIEAFAMMASDEMQNMKTMSAETAQQLDRVSDSFSILKQSMMIDLAPAIVWVIRKVQEVIITLKGLAQFWGTLSGQGEAGNVLTSMITGKAPSAKTRAAWNAAYEAALTWMAEEIAKLDEIPTPDPPPEPPPTPTPDGTPSGTAAANARAKTRAQSLYSDSLLSVGNFLGAAGGQANSVGQKQLVAMNSINDAVKTILSVMQKGGINFPS